MGVSVERVRPLWGASKVLRKAPQIAARSFLTTLKFKRQFKVSVMHLWLKLRHRDRANKNSLDISALAMQRTAWKWRWLLNSAFSWQEIKMPMTSSFRYIHSFDIHYQHPKSVGKHSISEGWMFVGCVRRLCGLCNLKRFLGLFENSKSCRKV